ncbi:SPOR domain-containing protein [Mariprofundus ferrooxydans]|uniref:SPOR domain-containing protein n=1 Tax=Mariprofundus ferrooxydans TaxID=314344 RepID=UPI001430B4C3|nr:SPOR domain-containing protein [Mariprofundus ferrooxydans]
MSEDNSGRNKQEQSSKQADGDQAAYLDSLIAQFKDDVDEDFAHDAGGPQPSAGSEPELIEPPISEPDESPSQATLPAETEKTDTTTDPTIVLLAGFILAIVLSMVLWLALNGDDDDKHAATDIRQPASQTAPAQTTVQPVTSAVMDQQTAPENDTTQPVEADQIDEHAVAPEQSAEPAATSDQVEEPATAPEQSEEPAATSDQIEEPATAPDQVEEPAAAAEQNEPSAPTVEQKQSHTPTQAASPPATMLHLYIDPVSRKVIAPKPAHTRISWAVNLTSISNLAIAEKIERSLDNRGIKTELVWVTIGNKSFYRIRIPGFTSKRAARQALRTYRKEREFSDAWIENYHPLPRTSE